MALLEGGDRRCESAGASPSSPIPPAAALAHLKRVPSDDPPGGAAQYAGGKLFLMVSGGLQHLTGSRVEIKFVKRKLGVLHVTAVLHEPEGGLLMALETPRAYAEVDAHGSGRPLVFVRWVKAD